MNSTNKTNLALVSPSTDTYAPVKKVRRQNASNRKSIRQSLQAINTTAKVLSFAGLVVEGLIGWLGSGISDLIGKGPAAAILAFAFCIAAGCLIVSYIIFQNVDAIARKIRYQIGGDF